MIRIIRTYGECRDLASGFHGDPDFSDPMLRNAEQARNNLTAPIENPERHIVLVIYDEGRMTGLFAFLVLRDEKYIETPAGLSREKAAYEEALGYLERSYPGCGVDFVFNPRNHLLKELLDLRGAEFEPEQQRMVLATPVSGTDTTDIEPLSDLYAEQYCDIHGKDVYWTGEKVLQAQDRFRTFLAIHGGKVIGYIDVTSAFSDNEPYELLVLEEYR